MSNNDYVDQLRSMIISLSLDKNFDYGFMQSVKNHVIGCNIVLTHDECIEFVGLLPKNQKWTHIYEHLIFSRIIDTDRPKLNQYNGVQGYYHPSTGMSEYSIRKQGLDYLNGDIPKQFHRFA